MGYITKFKITIHAASADRQLEIAKVIIRLARIGTVAENEAMEEFLRSGLLTFDAKWYHWDQDLRGDWYDFSTKGIRKGLHLAEGESLEIKGIGEEYDDMWKAFVSKRKFSQERCLRVDFIDKESQCIEDEGGDHCRGCASCATRVPIYE